MTTDSSDASQQYVLFADILGSGLAVESEPSFLTHVYGQLYGGQSNIRIDDPHSSLPSHRIAYAYSRFHAAVRDLLDDRVSNSWRFHTLITFSDSVIVVASSHHLSDYARWLMQRCIQQSVPVRMGLGMGGFAVGRFASEITPNRRQFANQFLGSGVVRAYWAESSGAKGMRILLHPSVAQALRTLRRANQPVLRHVLALDEREAGKHAAGELSYVRQRDEFDDDMQSWDLLVRHVEAMGSHQPAGVQHHYSATIAALARMREATSGLTGA